MRLRVVLVSLLVVLTACSAFGPMRLPVAAPSGPGIPSLSPIPSTTLVPLRCPKHLASYRSSGAAVPGAGRVMVPHAPEALVLCAGRSRVELQAAQIQPLVSTLIGLKAVPKGAVFNCPLDLGPSYDLFFNYSDGHVLLVTVTSSGCAFTMNGRVTAHTDRAELAAIKALLN